MKICVINFAYDPSGTSRNHVENQKRQNDQILSLEPDAVLFSYSRSWLERTLFYKSNKELLDCKRGAGFWAWKPYIILKSILGIGCDAYIYLDADVQLKESLQEFAHYVELQPIVAARTTYRHSRYCKDIVRQIIPCDPEPAYDLYAGVLAFSRSSESVQLLSDWMMLCLNKKLVDDTPSGTEPPFPDFIAPRNDQTILTRLYSYMPHNRIFPPSILKFTDLYQLPVLWFQLCCNTE